MKYFVELEGREYVVDIDPDGIRIDDVPVEVDLAPGASARLWDLLLDHVSYRLRAERAAERGSWEIELGGRRHLVVALDKRRKAMRRLSGSATGESGPLPYEVVAPMPGLVIAVEVSADEAVSSGQGLIVIEAMKMENEIKAKTAGQVTDIKVGEGQAVEKGETLLVIEPDGRRV